MTKTIINKFSVIIAALLIGVLLSSCNFQEVEVTGIENVSVTKINKDGVEFNIGLGLENPNNFSFTIQKIYADIYADDVYLGKIKNYKNFKVIKESKEVYPITFNLEFKSLKNNYLKALKTLAKRKTKIRVKGYVKAKKFIFTKKIYFDKEDTYKFLRLSGLKNLLQWK